MKMVKLKILRSPRYILSLGSEISFYINKSWKSTNILSRSRMGGHSSGIDRCKWILRDYVLPAMLIRHLQCISSQFLYQNPNYTPDMKCMHFRFTGPIRHRDESDRFLPPGSGCLFGALLGSIEILMRFTRMREIIGPALRTSGIQSAGRSLIGPRALPPPRLGSEAEKWEMRNAPIDRVTG